MDPNGSGERFDAAPALKYYRPLRVPSSQNTGIDPVKTDSSTRQGHGKFIVQVQRLIGIDGVNTGRTDRPLQ
jgi:hypothetical protein